MSRAFKAGNSLATGALLFGKILEANSPLLFSKVRDGQDEWDGLVGWCCNVVDGSAMCRGAKLTKNKNDQWSSAANPWYITHRVLQGTEAMLLELRRFMTLGGAGFPDSPSTTG